MAIYYITFGTHPELYDYNLQYSPAANQKSDYIIDLLDRMNKPYHVISLSRTGNKEHIWYPQKSINCGKNGTYTVWGMIGKPFKMMGGIQRIIRNIQLLSFLMSCKKEDTIIVYHSLLISKTVSKAKKIIGFKLVMELEEIYQDVVDCSKRDAKAELDVINIADKYILSTSMLEKKINPEKKRIVINGTYRVQPKLEEPFSEDKIHCVYAGTFDPTKGGLAAVDAAEFLSSDFHMHLLGFGSQKQVDELKSRMAEVQKKTECTISFDGLKSGEEYIRYLQKCHIGLCTQIPDAQYTETSFPSKVLVYLANGLRVLSIRIPTITQSHIGDLLYYYDNQSPIEIAKEIEKIDCSKPYDSRSRLKELDKRTADGFMRMID
ncbi:MAG: hypothetical protein J6F31_00925 [Oscillospiraceae bacterium]|nr:hypothetical protein [Oscillospiraceae bacterium]